MYVLLFVLVGLIVGIAILAFRYKNEYASDKKHYRYCSYGGFVGDDGWSIVGWAAVIICLGILIIAMGSYCAVRCDHRAEYEQKVILRDSIVSLMEDTKDKYKDSVYQAVVDFNSSVTEHRVKQNTFNWGIEYPNDLDWNDIPLIVPKGEYIK